MTAITQESFTPSDMEITVRNNKFDFDQLLATDWLDNDPYKTAILNALSITFPIGETFFVDSVRHYADKLEDPKLKAEVKAFYGQETTHRREHEKYNTQLCEARGYDNAALEKKLARRDAKIRELGAHRGCLASTAAAEHITAIFAAQVIQGWLLGNVDPRMAALWKWHSAEELEHKAVAFDVYRAIGGQEKFRKRVATATMLVFIKDVHHISKLMLKQDGQYYRLSTLKSAMSFWFGKSGIFRMFTKDFRAYYQDGFHPWDNDSRPLLAAWKDANPETNKAQSAIPNASGLNDSDIDASLAI